MHILCTACKRLGCKDKTGTWRQRRPLGRPGETILVAATDDTKVDGVSLVNQTAGGIVIEQGPAALDPDGGVWVYVAQATVPEKESAVAVEVTAVDLPGNRVRKQVDRILRRT